MKHSLKPTLYTFIPIIIIFGWLNANLAFVPLMPGEEFQVTAELKTAADIELQSTPDLNISEPTSSGTLVTWIVSGEEGDYILTFTPEGADSVDKQIIISSEQEYASPSQRYDNPVIEEVVIPMEKTKPLGSFSILGWNPGWLATYIILSLIFSLGLRKLLRIS